MHHYTLLAQLSEYATLPRSDRLASECSETQFSSAMENLAKWLPKRFSRWFYLHILLNIAEIIANVE